MSACRTSLLVVCLAVLQDSLASHGQVSRSTEHRDPRWVLAEVLLVLNAPPPGGTYASARLQSTMHPRRHHGILSAQVASLERADAPDELDSEPVSLLGVLNSSRDCLIGMDLKQGSSLDPGALLEFPDGTGVVYAQRSGVHFAALLTGSMPREGELVKSRNENLTVPFMDGLAWGGLHDYLGVPTDANTEDVTSMTSLKVFQDTVPALDRKVISQSLHTGVAVVDALTPIGRGQSMAIFGPEAAVLPADAGRTDLALRIVEGQYKLETDIKCVLVLIGTEDKRAQSLAKLTHSGAMKTTKVLQASNAAEALIAAQMACSIAQHADGDALVVIDDLQNHMRAWEFTEDVLSSMNLTFDSSATGAQLRLFFSFLTERTHRHKSGKSVTLVLVQPSLSTKPSENAKDIYTSADFASFTEIAKSRIAKLVEAGVELTPDVLEKVGIPLPGTDHRATGKNPMISQHLEEISSLVDGHIDLSEAQARRGSVPPLDLRNSLTRIGAGASLKANPSSAAMQKVNAGLRILLAQGLDSMVPDPEANSFMAVFNQPPPTLYTLGEEIALLLAAKHGLLIDVVEDLGIIGVQSLLRDFLIAISKADAELLEGISSTGKLPEEAARKIIEIGREFFKVRTVE